MTTSLVSRPRPVTPPLLKVRDVAKLLTVSRQTIRALIESGDLEAHALNPNPKKMKRSHVRITSKSLSRFYQKRVGHDLDPALLAQL
jgi:excisionase family DNA binding protein